MAGRVDRRERHARTADALAVVEAVDHLGRTQVEALEIRAEHPARAERVEQHVLVGVVDADLEVRRDERTIRVVHQRADPTDVVDVAVRVEQRDEAEPVMREALDDRASGRAARR